MAAGSILVWPSTLWHGGKINNNSITGQSVTAFLKVPIGAEWLIGQWKYSEPNDQTNYLCNDLLGPIDYGTTWFGEAGYGSIDYFGPDGSGLMVSIESGNTAPDIPNPGCLFWVNVSSVEAFN